MFETFNYPFVQHLWCINYLIIQLSDISNHLIIHLSGVSSVSDIVNYVIIPLSNMSSISDISKHPTIQLIIFNQANPSLHWVNIHWVSTWSNGLIQIIFNTQSG